MRICAISVDQDDVRHYRAIFGLPAEERDGAGSVHALALDRQREFARDAALPLTLFIVARDLEREAVATRLRALVQDGHEPGNHTLDHHYDLTRREAGVQQSQIAEGAAFIARVLGVAPSGFRAPGYTVSDELFELLVELGVGYDSSVFPCPPYYAAKAAALVGQRVRGRRSRSILDTPAVLRAPTVPYRVGRPYWRKGQGLLELPIQVAGPLRVPFIGTTLSLLGPSGARLLARTLLGQELINLELHALDFVDQSDGLADLAAHQPDLKVPVRRKLETLHAVIELLRRSGYAFVRLDEAARVFR